MGNGVTIEYIMKKGSACVETFRLVSHTVAMFFGDHDRNRRSKELAFQEDMRVLVEEMERHGIHRGFKEHFVPVIPPTNKPPPKKKSKKSTEPVSAIVDVLVTGAETWTHGKFEEFKRATAYDKALGYPVVNEQDERDGRLDTGTIFDDTNDMQLAYNNANDLFTDDDAGGVGGGGEFDRGTETLL